MRKVGIVGFGYVGQGMARLFKDVHQCHVFDPALDYHNRDLINGCDLAIVCVPTPEADDGSCDTSRVAEVCAWLETPHILIKSTVAPGTTSYLARKLKKKISFSPEFMGEPTNFVPPWKYPHPTDARQHGFVILGGAHAYECLPYFYPVMSTDSRFVVCTSFAAELAKYMENSFFATKITFCNEWAKICEAFGIEFADVRELWLTDPRPGGDHTVVNPDKPGFGGKCLPKDLAAIIKASADTDYDATFLKAVQAANERFRHGS